MAYKYRTSFTFKGKRYDIKANTKRELMEKEIEKRVALETNAQTASNMTLNQWATKCVDTYKTHLAKSTKDVYVRRMKHCILDVIGDCRLMDITNMQCQDILNRQQGKSKTQIAQVHQTLNFLFEKAIDNNLLSVNPAKKLSRPKGSLTHRRALTSKEREVFIEVGLTDRRYYYFMLMLFCGCRPSEATGAEVGDIVILDNGKPALHIRGTKTVNADRTVPIPSDFYEVLKKLKNKQEKIALTEKGGCVSENNRARIWNSFKRQVNIKMGCKMYRNALIPPLPLSDDIVPYCLRHEYCTNLARNGIDVRIAQRLMGHSDISLTANIYTNLDTQDIVTAVSDFF